MGRLNKEVVEKTWAPEAVISNNRKKKDQIISEHPNKTERRSHALEVMQKNRDFVKCDT